LVESRLDGFGVAFMIVSISGLDERSPLPPFFAFADADEALECADIVLIGVFFEDAVV
jgi:hypothetical protein